MSLEKYILYSKPIMHDQIKQRFSSSTSSRPKMSTYEVLLWMSLCWVKLQLSDKVSNKLSSKCRLSFSFSITPSFEVQSGLWFAVIIFLKQFNKKLKLFYPKIKACFFDNLVINRLLYERVLVNIPFLSF